MCAVVSSVHKNRDLTCLVQYHPLGAWKQLFGEENMGGRQYSMDGSHGLPLAPRFVLCLFLPLCLSKLTQNPSPELCCSLAFLQGLARERHGKQATE